MLKLSIFVTVVSALCFELVGLTDGAGLEVLQAGSVEGVPAVENDEVLHKLGVAAEYCDSAGGTGRPVPHLVQYTTMHGMVDQPTCRPRSLVRTRRRTREKQSDTRIFLQPPCSATCRL